MSQVLIVAAGKVVDGHGSLTSVENKVRQLEQAGISIRTLTIESLGADWHAPLPADHFRSGCGPIQALNAARTLVEAGAPAVLIRGEDLIKTGYERSDRLARMAIYGDDYPLTQAYDDVAQAFVQRQAISADTFRSLSEKLFENYQRTYRQLPGSNPGDEQPAPRWFNLITPLFRGVDCANPLIDFTGELLVCNQEIADQLDIPQGERIAVKGVGLGLLEKDGPDEIDTIARYDHLCAAYDQACQQAGIDFRQRYLAGEAHLDAYTCYPVVPLALLLNTGLVNSLDEVAAFLENHPITVTGGMNLARAPWNNPALNGMICMYRALTNGDIRLGAVHGNGGLGYRQGIALLERCG